MTIANIIDRRKRPYRFKKINAIVEAAWHDNRVKDADRVLRPAQGKDGPDYNEKEHITMRQAVIWGESFKTEVTLYLYDQDGGIYPKTRRQARAASAGRSA